MKSDNLQTQHFEINPQRDTTLIAAGGSILIIPKGSITSGDQGKVNLIVKEALTMKDIVSGGLVTKSGSKILSSGGMIYVNSALETSVTFNYPIKALLPTSTYNPDMQVYRGEVSDQRIDWVDPGGLPKNETSRKIENGKDIFSANCANCHKINDDFTGPALYGVTERRSKQWLYNFTRNPVSMTKSGWDGHEHTPPDIYSMCLFEKWKPTVMTAFPNLDDSDMGAIYSYVQSETNKIPPLSAFQRNSCCDKCAVLSKGDVGNLTIEEKFKISRSVDLPSLPNSDGTYPTEVKGTYYQLEMSSFGWHNIDILLENLDCFEPAKLMISVKETISEGLSVYFMIPSVKVFVRADRVAGTNTFIIENEEVLLPLGTQCRVFAIEENGDKLQYGETNFIASRLNSISLLLSKCSDVELKLKLEEMRIWDTANAGKSVIQTRDSIQVTSPQQTNPCDCFPVHDSNQSAVPIARNDVMLNK